MPIELWWWVEPLVDTGCVTCIVGAVVAIMVGVITNKWALAMILLLISVSPLVVGLFSAFVWRFVCIMILIWRC